jgi:hypothetical protein
MRASDWYMPVVYWLYRRGIKWPHRRLFGYRFK